MTEKDIIKFIGLFALTAFLVNPSFGQKTDGIDSLSMDDTTKNSDDSIRVTVYVDFIVDGKGELIDIEVVKTECDSCDTEIKKELEKEAIRLVSEMPSFKPYKKNGKPQKVKYNLPIRFVLANEKVKEDE